MGPLPTEVAEHLIACSRQGVRSALFATLERANVLVVCVPDAGQASTSPGIGVIRTHARTLAVPQYIVDPSTDLDVLAMRLRELEQVSAGSTRVMVTGPRGTRWHAGERLGWLVVAQLSLIPALPPTPRRHKILVVDDDHDVAGMTCALLRDEGHDAIAASTGSRSLEIAESFQPDIGFVDLALPDITGFELARQMRALRSRPMFLAAVTGLDEYKDPSKALAAGFDRHVMKPASTELIRGIVEQANLRLLIAS